MVLARLERVSADSALSHQASGVRGALLKSLDKREIGNRVDQEALERLLGMAFMILEQEARRYTFRFGGGQRVLPGRQPRT